MTYPDEHKHQFGVEPSCQVLTASGVADRVQHLSGGVSPAALARARRDAWLSERIRRVHADNYGVYGARKVWLTLHRDGVEVARCTVERLMRALGLRGVVRGRARRTTIADQHATRPKDLVQRRFTADRPNRL